MELVQPYTMSSLGLLQNIVTQYFVGNDSTNIVYKLENTCNVHSSFQKKPNSTYNCNVEDSNLLQTVMGILKSEDFHYKGLQEESGISFCHFCSVL